MIYRLKELIFKNKTTRQTMVKNVFWLSIGQFGSRFIRSAITIYSARMLGASEYGVFSYALGASSFFLIFSDIGISSILSREVAKQPHEEKKYFSTIFVLKIILLIFTAAMLLVIAPIFIKIEKAASLMPLVALLTIFDGLREFAFGFFRGKEKMELEAIITLSVNVAVTVFGFAILYISPTSLALLEVYALASCVGFLMTAYFLRKEYFGVIKNFSKELVSPVLKAAWPMAVGGLVGSFMFNVDVLMMGWWRTSSEIGFYSAAQKIVGMLYIFGGLLATAIGPAFFRIIHENNKERISAVATKSLAIVFLIALPLVVGGIILGSQIVSLIFGKNYSATIPVFKISIISLLVIYPFSILNNMIFAYNKQAKMIGYSIIATLTNIGFNILLIPYYGAVGAAIATLVANSVNVFFLWYAVKKINDFTIIFDLGKIIIAVVGMAIATMLIKYFDIGVIENVVISGIFYFLLLYLIKDKNFKELLSLAKI